MEKKKESDEIYHTALHYDEIKRWNLKEIAISSKENEVDLFEVEI